MIPDKTYIREIAESMIAHQTARSEPIQQETPPKPTMDFIRSLVLDVPVQAQRTDEPPMNIEKIIETQLEAEVKKIEKSSDPVDTVTVDIPLLLRLFEYSREDAKTDMDLHDITEKLIALSKEHKVLSMDQYPSIVQKSDMSEPKDTYAGDTQYESLSSLKKLAGIK